MQNQYDNTNRGAAFLRDKKSENAPTWSGPLNVEGKEYEISIWEKTSKAGKDFLSIKVGPPWVPKQKSDEAPAPKRPAAEIDEQDDIPF